MLIFAGVMDKIKIYVLALCSAVVLSSCDFMERNRPLARQIGRAVAAEIERGKQSGESRGKASVAFDGDVSLLRQASPEGVPEQMLRRTGYIASYNKSTKLPNWVAWHLTPGRTEGPAKRSGVDFEADMDVPAPRAEDSDYYGSGYDRGHMCPAADNKFSVEAMRESFLFTNMCPQNGNLNRGDWNEMEMACRRWAEEYDGLYIVCGPILYKGRHKTIGKTQGHRARGFLQSGAAHGRQSQGHRLCLQERRGQPPQG